MRDILFRAKAINRVEGGEYRTKYKNGDWVYGLIERLYDDRFENLPVQMINTNGVSGIDVDYRTIGQYTGFTDKNGVKIFEGDICYFYGGEYYSGFWEYNYTGKIEIDANSLDYLENAEFIEVIGNVYDNPELLEERK